MIPRRLHAFWGGPDMPDRFAEYLRRWRELHPSWQFTLWTPETIPELRHQDFYDDPQRFSPASNLWQHRANLVRYELLYEFGGFWVDCDLEPRKPIEDLRSHPMVAAWERQGRWINNAFLGAEPGHPALAKILSGIPASIRRRPRKRSNHQTGAQYITPILRRCDDVTVLDQRLVYPYTCHELHRGDEQFPDAIAVHHWANQRRTGAENGRPR